MAKAKPTKAKARTHELVAEGFERKAWIVSIAELADQHFRAELRVGGKVIHTDESTSEEWCLERMRYVVSRAFKSLDNALQIVRGNYETASATVVERDPTECGRAWGYTIQDGPHAGVTFYASDAYDGAMLVSGASVRVMFHADDQFAKRVGP